MKGDFDLMNVILYYLTNGVAIYLMNGDLKINRRGLSIKNQETLFLPNRYIKMNGYEIPSMDEKRDTDDGRFLLKKISKSLRKKDPSLVC